MSYADNVSSLSVGIRSSAFEKLAALAVQSPVQDNGSELARLTQQSRLVRLPEGTMNDNFKGQASISRVPMVRRPPFVQHPEGMRWITANRDSANSTYSWLFAKLPHL